MFKKLKDKLAEEVKSSPQRIQQFAQAATAAVTSASSSISDITNSELFSIGDNDTLLSRPIKGSQSEHKSSTSTFQDVSLNQPLSLQTSNDSMDFVSAQDLSENQRQRRLSNSSFASDVSFRLPSYESPSMYHLQSDMEVSASEAEGSGFSSGNVSLDRVTKEQIYGAYKRTQERYTKYRTQYADLARHYKLLERENAKARSVLVETQDKALRRISELREQCSLEQSAKAHLEKALRVEIEERNLKIDTLNTKIQFLQNNTVTPDGNETNITSVNDNNSNVQLITFDGENNPMNDEQSSLEAKALNNKIEKLEKLLNKYKDSLKTTKEKSAQLTTEIQILSGELEIKNKEIDQLKSNTQLLNEAKQKIQEMNERNEELQNKINVYDFNRNKEMSTLEIDLQKAQEEITQLQRKIDVFSKREEEYAISLAENKLSIHKELESKETEIKSLKDRLAESKQQIQSLDIVLSDYKNNTAKLEEECCKLKIDISELNSTKIKITELESQIQILTQKFQALENLKIKADEEYRCLQLQLKQETAEKMAMIDRNTYLENRNTQLTEENAKKSLQINTLDKELQVIRENTDKNVAISGDNLDVTETIGELDMWKKKCAVLESEIQEEREELGKLQSEIEKLLINDEHIQIKNAELNELVAKLQSDNESLRETQLNVAKVRSAFENISVQIKYLKGDISLISADIKSIEDLKNIYFPKITEVVDDILQKYKALDEQTRNQNLANTSKLERIIEQLEIAKEENFKIMAEKKEMELQKNELNKKLRQTSTEYEQALKDLNSMQNEMEKVTIQLTEFKSHYTDLQNTTDHYKDEQKTLKQKLSDMADKIRNSESGENLLKSENLVLKEKLEKLNVLCEQLQSIVNQNKNEQTILNNNIADMTEKINSLECSIESIEGEKQALVYNLEEANGKCKKLQDIINYNNNDQTILKEKFNNLESSIESINSQKLKLAAELEESNAKCEILQDIISRNNNEQTILKDTINYLNHEIVQLNISKNALEENISMKQKDLALIENKYVDESENIENLQQKIKDLTQENISLKSQSIEITKSIKELEIELRDVRKSHAEMEIEKDHLNSVIEQLEKNESEKESLNKNTQTNNKDKEQPFESEIISECELKQSTSENETKKEFEVLVNENDTLKEENKRLQSDVAGLQAYLAKISKENGVLNDKLRELIASSENSQDNDNITVLSSEVQQKDGLHNLIRENNLLLEENLELKDQLNSQHYAESESANIKESGKEMEYLTLKEKYASLLDINKRLEKRMLDLEQMSQSSDGNVSQMQQRNEKLRLTNEKLERRLDEALVSLRHLHALQENTELEYLKNILYEYLTGTGTHSVTLAKVLAAVVKFDKNQTEVVLQKEKERQGFLRQLGLL